MATTKKLKTLGRVRSVKPELFFDFELAQLNPQVRLAFIGLFCHADREGRLEDVPSRIRALLFPYETKVDMNDILTSLSKKPFIIRYVANSKHYIQIVKWEHQYVHYTEAESIIPPCNGEATVISPLNNGGTPELNEDDGGNHVTLYSTLSLTKAVKVKHLEFVYLTEKEYLLLSERIGKGNTDSYIARLNDYIGAKGVKYNSHYHVINGWWRKDHPETPATGPAGREL